MVNLEIVAKFLWHFLGIRERMGVALLLLVVEGTWIALAAVRVLATLLFDRLLRLVGKGGVIPASITCLEDAADMSALLGSVVLRSRSDAEKFALSEAKALGAGGTGTTRSWLTIETADGGARRVFAKMPASTTFEALFLTVFGVYENECRFYQYLMKGRERFREGLFAQGFVASFERGRFVLVLEDLAARPGGTHFPTAKSPHPEAQVKAALDAYASLHAATWNAPPPGVWTDERSCEVVGGAPTRPPFLQIVADSTLRAVLRRFPGLLPDDVLDTYRAFLRGYDAVRQFWSSGLLVLVHGDSHLGNIAFSKADGRATFYDLQCVAAEHPIRDVAYHLMISCDSADLAANERAYLAHYLDALGAQRLGPGALSMDDAWRAYRLHALWALCALVISAGASDLFEASMATLTISRVVVAMQRIDSRGALDDVLRAARKA